MTQHVLHQDIEEDHRTMRRLAIVVGCFVAASVAMAVTIGLVVG